MVQLYQWLLPKQSKSLRRHLVDGMNDLDNIVAFHSIEELVGGINKNISPEIRLSGWRWISKEQNECRLGTFLLRADEDQPYNDGKWLPFVRKNGIKGILYMVQTTDLAEFDLWIQLQPNENMDI